MRVLKTLLVALGVMAMPALAAAPATAPAAAPQTELAPAPDVPAPAAAPAAEAAPAADADATENAAEPEFEYAAPSEIGVPDGRYGISDQVTELGQRGVWFHDWLLMPIVTVITLFVLALMLWVIVRYRRSANPEPSKTSHNTLIEVIWTLVPVLILLVIAIPSIGLLSAQYTMPEGPTVTIKATGNQWYWTYEYPDHGGITLISNMLPEEGEQTEGQRFRTDADGPRLLAVDERMVVPVGTNIRVITTASDVIHAFAVPALWVKMDAVPGRLNETWFRTDRPGVYFGQCSELCGARHAYMPIAVEVVTAERFAEWVRMRGGTMPGEAAAAEPAAAPAAAPAANDNTAEAAEASNAVAPAAATN